MADEMQIGLICQNCGVYFEREHGHPVLCEICWADVDEDMIIIGGDGIEFIGGTKVKRAKYAAI